MSVTESENLSVKIVTADYYLHKPIPELGDQCYSAFRSSPVYRVPVIRIFGPTSEGVKTCLHVHGVFPYIFVPNWNNQIGEKELYNFAANLDKAINTSFAHSNSKSSHVHRITRVSGMPFYGYYEKERNFLKIEFYNPVMIKRASDLLLNGAVLNTIFQPHEAHIPYILQFFIDNNLYGMNNITFSTYRVRKKEVRNDINIEESFIGSNNNICQQSYSELEIDISVSNLCNVLSTEENIPNNPGLAFIWEDEKKRRRFNDKSSQITPNESQQRPEKPITRTERYFREKLLQKLQAIKDNQASMDIECDETPSSSSTYEELNTQSRSLLEILQSLASQQEKNKDATGSGSSSPSLVYSDDETNAVDVSLISSQPMLKFNAEDDSILGNNFSDDENDIDDHDHKALSQPISYSKHQNTLSSDDSDSGVGGIPQLDGAYDTKDTKKSTAKKVKPIKSRQKVVKTSYDDQNQEEPISERKYNLRSQTKPAERSNQTKHFHPKDFKIILKKLDLPKISPKKNYPRLNIDTQKSPRSNHSKSSQDYGNVIYKEPIIIVPRITTELSNGSVLLIKDEPCVSSSVEPDRSANDNSILKSEEPMLSVPVKANEPYSESLPTGSQTRNVPDPRAVQNKPSTKVSKLAETSSTLKGDRKIYPPLNISIRKSPKSSQKPIVDEPRSHRGAASLHGLKKRKIDFGKNESESVKTKEITQGTNSISSKWKKSLKRRKKDDTSFKIGDSFSLLQFRNTKTCQSTEKSRENPSVCSGLTNTTEMDSQCFSLRISAPESSNNIPNALEKSAEGNSSVEMETLQISDDEEDDNVIKVQPNVELNRKVQSSHVSNLLTIDYDDESLLAVPLDDIQNDENKPRQYSSAEPQSSSSVFAFPVIRIPRLNSNIANNSASSISFENSSIELNISDPTDDNERSPTKDVENANLTAAKPVETSIPDSKQPSVDLIFSQGSSFLPKLNENNELAELKLNEASINESKDQLDYVVASQSNTKQTSASSEDKPNSTKVPKKDVTKKKSLGMRIRKNMKKTTPKLKFSKNTSAVLPNNNDDGQSMEKLPMILVNQEDDLNKESDRNLVTLPDSFHDSDIELDIMKCNPNLSPKNSCNEIISSKNETNPSTKISHRNTLNSANSDDAICEKRGYKSSTKLTSPPCFEDSQLELDIFKCCSNSFEDSTEQIFKVAETVQSANLATSPIHKDDNNDQTDKAPFSSSIFNDPEIACGQESIAVPNIVDDDNSTNSQSIFSDEILNQPNTFLSDAAIGDNDLFCSEEFAFEQNSELNKNLAMSQSIFSNDLPGPSNTDLSNAAVDDNDLFYSQEILSEQNPMRDESVPSSQSILGDEILDKLNNISLPEQLIDDNDTFLSQQDVIEQNNNENMATSRNPATIAADDDLNTSCSNDSLLNVINSLTPSTKEALNRKLNSFEGENLATSQVSNEDLVMSLPQSENIYENPPVASIQHRENHRLQDQPSDDILDDSIIAADLATLHASQSGQHRARTDSETCHSAESYSPNILDKSTYTLNGNSSSTKPTREPLREEVLFEDESFDLASPLPPPVRQCETEQPTKKTPSLDKVLLNNSIWDSMDEDRFSQEDNEIQSFYNNLTATPAHITIITDIAQDEDDSSPIAKSLTPESQTSNEILSFYGSQSPESIICSISQDIPKASEAKFTPTNDSISSQIAKQRSARCSSPVLPHSTPAGSSTKKTPSPLYTPILKKLMIKKVNDKDKRRISSQRFRGEPFLDKIKEEEEERKRKEPDKNTTLSLPLEFEYDVSKIDGKSLLNTSKSSTCSGASCQIDGASLENTCGFKMNLENLQDIKTDKQFLFITQISLEVFAQTRGDLKPDPEYDAVTCIFYSIHHDSPRFPDLISGIIVANEEPLAADLMRFKCEKTVVSSETELFDTFLALIRKWDPDMFIGYEVEMLSWGFLIQRGYFLGRNLSLELSRVRDTNKNEPIERPVYEDDEYSNEIKLPGRIVLNVWRLMRHEVNLQSYTFENILFHVLHQRVPYHNFKFLTTCWKNTATRWIVVDYFLFRAESNIALLEQLDFICRTSELARLFGIQFYEVLSRGSQFRVESMMLRLAKTQNYVAVSPSIKQRAHMRAPESLPLIMEPESKFYTDPVIVLDFQSLYPSIIIAYNYCFSTCLGRIDSLGQNEAFHFGCVEHTVPGDLLVKLENSLNLSPAGVAFVDKTIRKGILPSMLEEILETRLMVKKSMKENKNNSILKRVLHARQLGLKLIANVTYGYTSANFSGRMPCMEIADSVVSKGRETLERAIELVNGTEKWAAKVVYGDTDSLFVMVPNRTKEEAFRIGSEIAEAVTNQNPKPVKLKLEKVYTASILQTKKRYVGYMYESVDQEKPVYDAKGIETVRRDGCPAVSKILEKSLKLLFETKNVNTVKQYVQRQFSKLISGRISIQELTFAREYRGMNNYKPAACVPALQLAKQALMKDRRAEPRVKERVRYVIVTGAPGVPLIRLVRTPEEFLDSPGSLINTEYYITRAIIPALERCFTLMNVNVQAWYTELPKKQKLNLPIDYEFRNKTFKKTTISHYFSSTRCISCSNVAGGSVCRQCEHKPQRLALILGNMINQWQRKHNYVAKICRSCCARNEPIGCSSLDCPIYYLFRQTNQDAEQVRYAENLKREYLYF